MTITTPGYFAERRRSLAKYMCNLSDQDRLNILDKQRTPAARDRLLNEYYQAKANQIFWWPDEMREMYLRRVEIQEPKKYLEIINRLKDIAKQVDYERSAITA